VLGPPRSGKTSAIVIPNVLAAPGAVVSTSTKPDVLGATAAARRGRGQALLYDPSGTVAAPPGVDRVGWSPVNASRRWDGALLTADTLVRSTRRGTGWSEAIDDHWRERATSLLAPILHAAALDDRPMATVLSWVDRHDGTAALRVLGEQAGDGRASTDLLAGILDTDGREQSGIWSTASGVLAAYRSSAALASTEGPFLDADRFCQGADTLYICAAGRQQQLAAPLVVGLVGDVRDAAYRASARGTSGAPVLLALDEAANIAPVPDLPAMVSEGAGQGLLTLACLQDLSQARSRWGADADGFISLFGTTVVLSGIADVRTLEAISLLAGDVELPTRSIGWTEGPDRRLSASHTLSTVFRRRLPPDVIARGRPGSALTLDAHNRVGWVGLTPAHTTSPWQELLGPVRDRATLLPGASRSRPEGADRSR
jgi:type IV secretory pathway TraG/TraD family ATPase VirD4